MEIITSKLDSDFSDRYIYTLNSLNLINEIREILLEGIEEKASLAKIHNYLEINKLNQFRLKCFNKINKIPNLKKKIYDSITPNIFHLLGMDLAIQKNLNLSIQMPNDDTSLLAQHIDYESGDSPFQWVLWIPITDCYESNAMYMNNPDGKYSPIHAKKGQFILFDPNTPHGNKINRTEDTRISVNIRLKNWFSPDLGNVVPDRQHGIYYEDFCFCESTLRAFNLVKNTIKRTP